MPKTHDIIIRITISGIFPVPSCRHPEGITRPSEQTHMQLCHQLPRIGYIPGMLIIVFFLVRNNNNNWGVVSALQFTKEEEGWDGQKFNTTQRSFPFFFFFNACAAAVVAPLIISPLTRAEQREGYNPSISSCVERLLSGVSSDKLAIIYCTYLWVICSASVSHKLLSSSS